MRDLDIYSGTTKTNLALPASKTSSGRSASVDLRDFTGKGFLVLTALNTAGTNPTLDVKLETSTAADTGQGDVSGVVFAQVTDTPASIQMIPVDFDDPNLSRYADVYWTIGGTSSPAFTLSVSAYGRKRTI